MRGHRAKLEGSHSGENAPSIYLDGDDVTGKASCRPGFGEKQGADKESRREKKKGNELTILAVQPGEEEHNPNNIGGYGPADPMLLRK